MIVVLLVTVVIVVTLVTGVTVVHSNCDDTQKLKGLRRLVQLNRQQKF